MNRRALGAGLFLILVAAAFIFLANNSRGQIGQTGLEFSAAESDEFKITHIVTVGDRTYSVEVAASTEEQAAGLSNRASMPETTGMLFPFWPAERVSFWMKDMRFALDLVWIANGRVIGVEKAVPAPTDGTPAQDLPTYSPPSPVDYVLELNAGQSQFFTIGDEVTITEIQSA